MQLATSSVIVAVFATLASVAYGSDSANSLGDSLFSGLMRWYAGDAADSQAPQLDEYDDKVGIYTYSSFGWLT